ncbi:MAG TPA: glycosyltransferase family 2 protein [Polyangiaceae bacterium]|nr:glycosyltransferase family 2 protein [Polyangiaceae bacterium]
MDVLALSALALIAYTYFGYPVMVAALARLSRVTRSSDPGYQPTVSVCIAVYNGEKYMAGKLDSLLELDYPHDHMQFLIYSDGSSDGTDAIVKRYAERDPRIVLLRGEQRKGKPAALNALAGAATGEVLLMTDVRPGLSRETVRALVLPLSNPEVGCVSGNLVLRGSTGAGAYWRYEKFIRMSEARLGRMVGVTGTIYAIRRADFPVLPEDVILDDVWVPMQVTLARKRIAFAEAAQAYEDAFEDDREFGRKVRTLAGNYQLFVSTPRLLSPTANPAWFQLLSHKALRLVCPWALAVLFCASVAAAFNAPELTELQRTFWRTMVYAQCLFYGLAVLGSRAGRVAGLARTFVVLNAAAVLGLWRFARGSQRVTW